MNKTLIETSTTSAATGYPVPGLREVVAGLAQMSALELDALVASGWRAPLQAFPGVAPVAVTPAVVAAWEWDEPKVVPAA